jgi:hypothetical protein
MLNESIPELLETTVGSVRGLPEAIEQYCSPVPRSLLGPGAPTCNFCLPPLTGVLLVCLGLNYVMSLFIETRGLLNKVEHEGTTAAKAKAEEELHNEFDDSNFPIG